MASGSADHQLSRRERQIMDAVYQQGRASVAEVRAALPDAPSYSAVRALMNVLVQKGHLAHRKEGVRYIYRPKRSRRRAARSELRRTVSTFFDGSAEDAVAALLEMSGSNLSEDQLDRLADRIDQARKEGR